MNTIDILISIRQIMRSVNQESKRIEKDHGVSIPQILCLNYLKRSPNFQSTQNELRLFLNLNGSSMHGLIERLEKKGLIARLPKSGDRRKVQISLTAKGDKLTGTIPPTLLDRLAKNLVLQDEQTLTGLQSYLQLLTKLMEINVSTTDPTPAET
ncbi:MAG: MarR family winged helix-turn-helix transcriptional regulator [Bacteroidota bacterium]